jgi:hypothetical protein
MSIGSFQPVRRSTKRNGNNAPGQAPPREDTTADLIGAKSDYVLSVLGEPLSIEAHPEGDLWTYETTSGVQVLVSLKEGAVTGVGPNDVILKTIKSKRKK